MLSKRRKTLVWCAALLSLVLPGCGRDDKFTPVYGQVYYHGRPLAGGTIVFTPDPERGGHGPMACGEIGPDGHYSLKTGDVAGAVPGWHRVTIAPPAPAASSGSTAPPPAIDLPRKYGDPQQSGLLREIHADRIAEQDFHLE